MATVVSFNNGSFTIPSVGEEDWGGSTKVDGFLVAVANNALAKSGGLFTLTSEVDFGGLFGQKTLYYKSRGVNTATSGVIRLSNQEEISWRSFDNTKNLSVSVNDLDQLEFNGKPLISSSGYVFANSGGTGLTTYQVGDVLYADTSSSLASLPIGADNELLIVSSGIPSWGLISDSNIDASASISRNKIAAENPNHVLINDGSGIVSSEQELSVVRGGTGASSLSGYVKGNGTSPFSASNTIPRSDVDVGNAGHVVINDGSGSLSSEAQLSVSRGGTGASSLSGYVSGNGVGAFTASATIPRSDLSTGTANHVLINSGLGEISSEAQLSKSRGGCGANVSSVTFPSSGVIVTEDAAQSLSNKSIEKRIQSLVDNSTISIDASAADIFRVLIGGNRTLLNPTNLVDGQTIQIQVSQDSVGGRSLAYDTMFRFSLDLPQPTLTATPFAMDRLLFEYNSTGPYLDLIAVNKGYL